jgi:uncharacterized protein (UPF0335 family)
LDDLDPRLRGDDFVDLEAQPSTWLWTMARVKLWSMGLWVTFLLPQQSKKGKHMQKITTGGVEVPKLRSYIERIERLEEDKAGVASDIKDVFAEAKSNGFDIKAMRGVIKLRKMKSNERTEAEYMLDLYKRALGMDGAMDEDDAEAA